MVQALSVRASGEGHEEVEKCWRGHGEGCGCIKWQLLPSESPA